MPNQDPQCHKLQCPDCSVSDEQRMIQRTLAEFVDREIMPMRHKIDDDATHEEPMEPILKGLQVDLGWRKSMIPKQDGGNEMMSLVTAALRQERLSRADCGISPALACVDWTPAPATKAHLFGASPATKAWGKAALDELAPKVVEDRLRFGCFNMSEAESAFEIENHLNAGSTATGIPPPIPIMRACRKSGITRPPSLGHFPEPCGLLIRDEHCQLRRHDAGGIGRLS